MPSALSKVLVFTRCLITVVGSFLIVANTAIAQKKPIVYLFSGQGSDERIFQEMPWDTATYEVAYLPYLIPERGERMQAYARRMAVQIDTTRTFAMVGVSLGGMIACEINQFTDPAACIIISSAKCRNELPHRYRLQRFLPLYKLVPKAVLKAGALVAQPIVEPDRSSHKSTFVAMLKAKDKRFVKRSIHMIMHWDKPCNDGNSNVIHIHGNNDHTLPISHISATEVVDQGSHMMTLTKAKTVFAIIEESLAFE